MIELETGLPENTIIATAYGKLKAEDYEQVLMPAIDAATAGGAKLRILFTLAEDFDGVEPSAALDDAKTGLKHFRDFERMALVTDEARYRTAVRAFGFMMPGDVKVYPLSEAGAARSWITE